MIKVDRKFLLGDFKKVVLMESDQRPVITSILKFAFQSNIIDSAIGTIKNAKGNVLPAIATDEKDLENFSEIFFIQSGQNSFIKKAIQNPRTLNIDNVNAQQTRRLLDRIVGYKLSPLLGQKIQRGLSAGRVQSSALKLIVDREREIEAFKPQEYWKIKVSFKDPKFVAELNKENGKVIKVTAEREPSKLP